MSEAFSFKPGELTKSTSNNKIKTNHIYLYKVIYALIFLACLITTFFIFKKCMGQERELSDTISLGSIFATFGSSIVAIFSITCTTVYERFNHNFNILFTKIAPDFKWTRWPFVKRVTSSKLYNNESSYQELKNAEVIFNVGSHSITITLPTILEDFYDLANWKSYLTMLMQTKNYETYVLNNILNSATSLMVWDCIKDNFKSIALYKLSRLMIVIGESLIISSIVFAFLYTKIPF